MRDFDLSLYLVTDDVYLENADSVSILKRAIEAGITALQYRFKKKSASKMYEELLVLREITKHNKTLLIVNDRVDLALAVKADGVHIGQKDLPPDVVRSLVGDEMIIGYSVNSVDKLLEIENLPIDYIGFGSVFDTSTKSDYTLVGLDGLRKACGISSKPVVAIGGITSARVPEVLSAGAKGIAVVSAILGFEDIRSAVSSLREAIKTYYTKKLHENYLST
ncbi:MAG: thiamine phosphate synthase [Aquificaceae bacterium]|nr:thiamine phosphate synthase [Aquificaceae bacterium]MDW8237742.1 thiamine phosphate synthase [Aquificaceae bacterium]